MCMYDFKDPTTLEKVREALKLFSDEVLFVLNDLEKTPNTAFSAKLGSLIVAANDYRKDPKNNFDLLVDYESHSQNRFFNFLNKKLLDLMGAMHSAEVFPMKDVFQIFDALKRTQGRLYKEIEFIGDQLG